MNTVTKELALDANETAAGWVDAYGDYLYNFAIGQLHDPDVAEDLVQETFLAALKGRDRFGARSAERTWLVSILRHKIYDHLRKTCRERARRVYAAAPEDEEQWEDTLLWAHDVANECHTPGRRMELEEFRLQLENALGKLPPRLARVFQMYEVEQKSNAEVCESLNISDSNLWVMLHRSRKALRDLLTSWWQGEPSQRK